MAEKLTIVVVERDKDPFKKEINHTLKEMQSIVDGDIETTVADGLPDGVVIVCNAEGKLLNMKINRLIYRDGVVCDYVAGTFFIVGVGEEDFVSLTDEQIQQVVELYAA